MRADLGGLVSAIPGPDATREEVDRFREDVITELGAFKKAATPAEFDAVVTKAGIKGKSPKALSAEDVDRINEALPAPFHVSF